MSQVTLEVESIDLARAVDVADGLARRGRALAEGAGGADRSVPTVPEGGLLSMMIVRFDEAREAFERRLAEIAESAGGRLTLNALETRRADTFPLAPLPEAGR